ncbi:MAG TPA: carboxypeptidase-like regulatory domain-containing protein [Candidatus Thermoplasmatota archaeon]|nr:carboxypeptidase-like regulatory domain-containing protein [Candidatus Thermoplasmatota archaeon]
MACLLVAAALAGCAQAGADQTAPTAAGGAGAGSAPAAGSGATPASGGPGGASAAPIREGTGAISGVVVDPTITPVRNATVQVKGLARNHTTGANGAFELRDLRPGVYFIEVHAARFLMSQTSVDVQAGKTQSVRIVLEGDGSPTPRHLTEKFKGHADFYAGLASGLAEGTAIQCDCAWTIHPDAGFQTFVLEAKGTTGTPPPPAVYKQTYWGFYDPPKTHGTGNWADFPFSYHIPGKAFPNGTADIEITIDGNFWPSGAMDFDVFVTTFYWEAAPEGWSFLKGDE